MTRACLLAIACLAACAAPALAASSTVVFASEDGTQLVATLWEPSARSAPAVVMVPSPARPHGEWARLGEQLAARGIAALAFEVRAQVPSVEGETPVARGVTTADIAAAVRYLHARPDLQVGNIGLAGASLGATLAVVAAASIPNVRSLALLSPVLDFRGLKIEEPLKRVAERPALLMASNEDSYASRSARALAQTGPGVRELLLVEGAGNGARMLASRPDLIGSLVDWFSRTLL